VNGIWLIKIMISGWCECVDGWGKVGGGGEERTSPQRKRQGCQISISDSIDSDATHTPTEHATHSSIFSFYPFLCIIIPLIRGVNYHSIIQIKVVFSVLLQVAQRCGNSLCHKGKENDAI